MYFYLNLGKMVGYFNYRVRKWQKYFQIWGFASFLVDIDLHST